MTLGRYRRQKTWERLKNCVRGNPPQFSRFNLVETPAIRPSVVEKRLHRQIVERIPKQSGVIGSTGKESCDWRFRVKHQIDVGGNGIGMVENEPEGIALLLVCPAHVRAKKRR